MIQGAALQRVLGKEVLKITPSCPNENRRHLEQLSVASEAKMREWSQSVQLGARNENPDLNG